MSEFVEKITALAMRDIAEVPYDQIIIKGVTRGTCKSCDHHVYSDDNFCRHCGQRIEWREEQ